FLYFCFRVEDGIRDRNVTGVQTCALPISGGRGRARSGCTDRCAWPSRLLSSRLPVLPGATVSRRLPGTGSHPLANDNRAPKIPTPSSPSTGRAGRWVRGPVAGSGVVEGGSGASAPVDRAPFGGADTQQDERVDGR